MEIVVSWNSTDTEALERLRERYPAFRWHQPPQPLEMGANWDYCLSQAKGEWGLVLSYDDQLLPDRLVAMLPTLAACDDHVGCFFGLSAVENAVVSPPKVTFPFGQFKPRLWQPGELWMRIPWGTPVHLPAAFFRRAAWHSAGGFDNGLAFACDAGLWERLCRHHAIWTSPACWSIYRWHAYSAASARAAREDAVKLAGIYRAQLGSWDFFGRLVCRFGFSRQERLAIQMNSEYHTSVVELFSRPDRLIWKGLNRMEGIIVRRHLVNRLIFRILLSLWQLTRRQAQN